MCVAFGAFNWQRAIYWRVLHLKIVIFKYYCDIFYLVGLAAITSNVLLNFWLQLTVSTFQHAVIRFTADREGRCCYHGTFLKTCLSGSRLSWPLLAKAGCGLVLMFHWWEEKLAMPLGCAAAQGCWLLPRSSGSDRQEMRCCNPSWRVAGV